MLTCLYVLYCVDSIEKNLEAIDILKQAMTTDPRNPQVGMKRFIRAISVLIQVLCTLLTAPIPIGTCSAHQWSKNPFAGCHSGSSGVP